MVFGAMMLVAIANGQVAPQPCAVPCDPCFDSVVSARGSTPHNVMAPFDGDDGTWYNDTNADGGWVEGVLSVTSIIKSIYWRPAPWTPWTDYHGGEFIGISPSGENFLLATLDTNPGDEDWYVSTRAESVELQAKLVAVRYSGPPGSYSKIASIEVHAPCIPMPECPVSGPMDNQIGAQVCNQNCYNASLDVWDEDCAKNCDDKCCIDAIPFPARVCPRWSQPGNFSVVV